MTDYLIKPHKDHYLVSVFEDEVMPKNQYHVWDQPRPFCTCPGYPKSSGQQHKHFQLLKAWKQAGSPGLSVLTINQQGVIEVTQAYTIQYPP